MSAPTLLTICARWPSLVDDVFPHWSKTSVSECFAEIVGPDWAEAPLQDTALRLVRLGLLTSPDDDPKDTFQAIKAAYLDRIWVRRAAALAHQEDAQ
jgi:hypothetical protein